MIDGVAQNVRVLAGRYQVGELIGRGGMADVHVGTDSRLGRRVAIKLLKPTLANDPAFRTRFRREAQDAAKMAHPTIVRIFDAGEEVVREQTGIETLVPFIVMEYVEGRLLKDMIAEGPMDPAEAAKIIEQVLTALEYSHRAGVVHRDIKPGNIMVTAAGQVKVMDFGIARAISDSQATIAETSAIVGTAQYFSPEQARGEGVDARTDLYSTGIVLFELLTGRAPFRGDNPVAVAYQHVNSDAVPPSSINPEVSPALDAVVLRSLTKDRFERYQTASEFRQDVEVAAAGQVPLRKAGANDAFHATLFGANPSTRSGSDATLRQLSIDNDRSARTQSRPPVAWIWAGIATMVVIIVAVVFWAFNLTARPARRRSRGDGARREGHDVGGSRGRPRRPRPQARSGSMSSMTTCPRTRSSAPIPEAGISVSPGLRRAGERLHRLRPDRGSRGGEPGRGRSDRRARGGGARLRHDHERGLPIDRGRRGHPHQPRRPARPSSSTPTARWSRSARARSSTSSSRTDSSPSPTSAVRRQRMPRTPFAASSC